MSKSWFSVEELNTHKHELSPDIVANLKELADKLSQVRDAFGRAMIVTSGFRSREDQQRIYQNSARVPYGSMHLIGCAADIADRDGSLASFAFANVKLLESVGLWCEDPSRTKGWVHFQSKSPASGSRFFTP